MTLAKIRLIKKNKNIIPIYEKILFLEKLGDLHNDSKACFSHISYY